jgi:hypothetical protein
MSDFTTIDRLFSCGSFGFGRVSWSQLGDGKCMKVEFRVTRRQLVHAKLPTFNYDWLLDLRALAFRAVDQAHPLQRMENPQPIVPSSVQRRGNLHREYIP